jgi:threonine dehydrogenase-like Zn-dependent dehydrogenase
MLATLLYGERDIRVEEVDRPTILSPDDAVVRITASCICGSDLHPYRRGLGGAQAKRSGHEFVGIVEETGSAVTTVKPGDFVIAPFAISDGTCVNCRNGVTIACTHGAFWGGVDEHGNAVDGGQGEYARVPLADGTLVRVPDVPSDDLVPHLLTLSDVMGTGFHAAKTAAVTAGSTVVVVGDGAVGLCGIVAAKRLGAERIIAMSRHPERQKLATEFGATDIVTDRGDDGIAHVVDLLGGIGADSVLECVGTQESMDQAAGSARPGGYVGFVGAPSGSLPTTQMFSRDLHFAGGTAPVRAYLPELLEGVLDGSLRPGAVFDSVMPLADVAAGYVAMDDRSAIKVMLVP